MSDPQPDDIIGHATFSTGRVGPFGFPEVCHEPITRAEGEALLAQVEAERQARETAMPTERDAVLALTTAHQRLKELGWKDAIYCPKDGSPFLVIEAGSSGIHECVYLGAWPTGGWFIHGDGDLWPAHPVLFKLKPDQEGTR